jgi:hypothetical protein
LKDSLYRDLLQNAIKHVCITNKTTLPIFGSPDHLCISLHELYSTPDENHDLARQIDLNHRPLHDPSQYKIICHIRINCKIISKQDLYLRQAISLFGNCIGLFFNFANGPINLQLTGIIQASRETSILFPQQVTSKINKANKHILNLTPGPPTTITPSPHSLCSPTHLLPQGRGNNVRNNNRTEGCGNNGRNNNRTGPPPHHLSSLNTAQDSGSILYRIARTSNLSIYSNASHKYYVIINGVGGIAVGNIYSMNFDNGGIRTLINHVPFNMHQSYATHPEAWTYLTSFFPHLHTPEDALFMNKNCPAKASNLMNPIKLFRDLTGFTVNSALNTREYFYFDHLPPDIQAKCLGASRHMFKLDCNPSNDYTFFPIPPPTTPTTPPTGPLATVPNLFIPITHPATTTTTTTLPPPHNKST